jgi:hypothetical protein
MKTKENTMKYALLIIVALASGCASIPMNQGAAGVATAMGKPDYARNIEKVADLLVGKRVNPVEGFNREERWFHRGEEINPVDLKLEVVYRHAYQISAAYMSPSIVKPAGEVSDAELRAEIEAILRASGVAE